MIINQNPYASPHWEGEPATAADFRDIFLGWERLRWVYNAVLAVITLVFGMRNLLSVPFWELVIEGGILANVCYCVGPVAEGYLTWLSGRRFPNARWAMFLVGLLMASALACLAIARVVVIAGVVNGI